MLGSIFKKMIGSDHKTKSFKEFKSIMELNSKVLIAEKEYGVNENSAAQKGIIKNNLLTLAKVYEGISAPTITMDYNKKGNYFNLQGTKPVVHILEDYNDEYTHKETNTVTKVIIDMSVSDLKADIISLEEKFRALNATKFKTANWEKIQKIVKEKIEDKVELFSNSFKGNEEIVKDFILQNLSNIDINHDSMVKRLNFVYQLSSSLKYNISDPKDIEIANKDIILINESVFDSAKSMDLKGLLESFKQLKYDFIILK